MDRQRYRDLYDQQRKQYEQKVREWTSEHGVLPKGVRCPKETQPLPPKRPLSSFFLFNRKQLPGLREEHPGWTFGALAKEISKEWRSLSEETRQEYTGQSELLRAEYEKEVEEWISEHGPLPKKMTEFRAASRSTWTR
mmetsp:Transcript_75277/g.203299  ORF Transcript_75277/g.203299 Transcript_75277/m.203299 type:complete len:138 (+) Transcript_75277:1-414(+)